MPCGKHESSLRLFRHTRAIQRDEKEKKGSEGKISSKKIRGKRQVEGFVKIMDDENQSVQGANVIAHWIFPDGSTQVVEDITSSSGNAHFEIIDVPRGIYSLNIQDVMYEGYTFDSENSILSKSIDVR